MSSGFLINLAILINIYCILSVSFNLTLGYTGLINLGHIAFYALGAYVSALLAKDVVPLLMEEGWENFPQEIFLLLTIFLGGTFAMLVSYALTYFIRKLKGDYLAMATLSFALALHNILLTFDFLTYGTLGVTNITRPPLFKNNLVFLLFVTLITVFCFTFIKKIVDSPFGNLIQAVRDDEVLLRSYGKDSFLLKIKVMGISAFFAGVAGALFAYYISYIHPDFFNLNEIIIILTIVIIGGLASIKGTVVAGFIVVLLPEMIRLLDIPQSIMGPTRQVIYGLLLLIILRFYSRGLFGKVDLHDY